MELKPCMFLRMAPVTQAFNRTAYGIETIKIIASKVYCLTFNRTAYGIETGIPLVLVTLPRNF